MIILYQRDKLLLMINKQMIILSQRDRLLFMKINQQMFVIILFQKDLLLFMRINNNLVLIKANIINKKATIFLNKLNIMKVKNWIHFYIPEV